MVNETSDERRERYKAALDVNNPFPEKDGDPVNPQHYKTGGIETADYLAAKFPISFPDHCLMSAIAYLSRAGKKVGSSYEEDVKKAIWFLNRAVEHNK